MSTHPPCLPAYPNWQFERNCALRWSSLAAFGSFGSKANLNDLNQILCNSIRTGFKRNWPGDMLQKSGICRESVVWLADAFSIISTRTATIFIYFSDFKAAQSIFESCFCFGWWWAAGRSRALIWDGFREQPETAFLNRIRQLIWTDVLLRTRDKTTYSDLGPFTF